jgi:hypothetical protein
MPPTATETHLVTHPITPIPPVDVEVATVCLHLVSVEVTRTYQWSHLKQSPATKISVTQGERAKIATGRGTANESESVFVTGVGNGNSTGKERKNDVTGTCADQRWSDALAATQMPSVDATTPDGIRDLRGKDGINACHLRSGGQVLLQHQEDGMLSRLTPKLGC